jgi:3-oxoacyl-[acyl-carrier-protein] synthase III
MPGGARALSERGRGIIVGTVTPDMMFPSTACLVQDKIGAKGAWGFDVSAGCSGFVFALQAGVKLVESGAHKKVLVIGRGRQYAHDRLHRPDDVRSVWRRRRGGAAGAGEEGEIGFIDFVHEIDGSGGVR